MVADLWHANIFFVSGGGGGVNAKGRYAKKMRQSVHLSCFFFRVATTRQSHAELREIYGENPPYF